MSYGWGIWGTWRHQWPVTWFWFQGYGGAPLLVLKPLKQLKNSQQHGAFEQADKDLDSFLSPKPQCRHTLYIASHTARPNSTHYAAIIAKLEAGGITATLCEKHPLYRGGHPTHQ